MTWRSRCLTWMNMTGFTYWFGIPPLFIVIPSLNSPSFLFISIHPLTDPRSHTSVYPSIIILAAPHSLFHLSDWTRNDLDFYSDDTWFISQLQHRLSWLGQIPACILYLQLVFLTSSHSTLNKLGSCATSLNNLKPTLNFTFINLVCLGKRKNDTQITVLCHIFWHVVTAVSVERFVYTVIEKLVF